MKRIACALFLTALLPACGDDADTTPDAGSATADASTSPDADDQQLPDAGPEPATVFALGTDYQSPGLASTIELPALTVSQNVSAGTVGSDPVARRFGGQIYVANRQTGNNVTILNEQFQLVDQIATGANPYDVAVVGNKLYVPIYGGTGVDILDVTQPNAGAIDTIVLSDLDPTDDQPNCNSAYAVGEKVYVTCQILDSDNAAQGDGKLVVIDTTSDTVDRTLSLEKTNPASYLTRTPEDSSFGGALLIGSVGSYGSMDGCIERIDPGPTPSVEGCVVTEADLGGDLASFVYAPDDTLWVAYSDQNFTGHVAMYDVVGESVTSADVTPDGQSVTDLALCPNGHVAMADGTPGAAGVRVYDGSGTELTTDALDIGAPPVFVQGMVCY